jgi:hypothetical protein
MKLFQDFKSELIAKLESEKDLNVLKEYFEGTTGDVKLETLEKQLKLISYKVKFILMIVEKKLDINNKKKVEIEEKLIEHKFPKIDESYKYLCIYVHLV